MRTGAVYFPGGLTGVGLLLLRFGVAASALILPTHIPGPPDVLQIIGIVVAAGLCAGFRTRLLAAFSFLVLLPYAAHGAAPPDSALLQALPAAALAMTGAGAFSADARLFGRRTVTLPNREDTIV